MGGVVNQLKKRKSTAIFRKKIGARGIYFVEIIPPTPHPPVNPETRTWKDYHDGEVRAGKEWVKF